MLHRAAQTLTMFSASTPREQLLVTGERQDVFHDRSEKYRSSTGPGKMELIRNIEQLQEARTATASGVLE